MLKHLLAPIKIKTMELANRVVLPAMGTQLGNPDATVSEALLAYLKRRVKGGAGLVITEITAVHPSGIVSPNQIAAYDDCFISGLKKLSGCIHEAGGKAAMQLHHAGRESFFLLNKKAAIAPSAIPSPMTRLVPREITRKEISDVIVSFARAAIRARESGFDAVEVHAAHGYLLMQFFSALSNQRNDEYGGTFKNRARFTLEVLKEIRREVGEDFPILLRISTEEFIQNGYTIDEMQTILPDLIKAGADVIHASVGTYGSPALIFCAPPEYQPGFNVWRAKKVKEKVDVPVITVGRFADPDLADKIIADGEADLVSFGRQHLADPDFLAKFREGRPKEIRKCIACNQGCIERLILEGKSIRCAINPETGQETIYPRVPAARKRSVWVIGGGPAGLTAASEAARLGHKVTLFEKKERLGGQLNFMGQAPHKEGYFEWISWLIFDVKKQGVKIRTNTIVTNNMLEEIKDEVVILATGGKQAIPPVPGIDLPMVHDALQILDNQFPPQKNVIVIGGGLIGMETADFLTKRGSMVTIIEILKSSPVKKVSAHGFMLHSRLQEKKCRFLFNTTLKKIETGSVTIIKEKKEEIISPVDQVIIAVGMKPLDDLKKTLEKLNILHFIVGDASQVGRIIEATEKGAWAAWNI
ncbi:MAG: FAD-dependent oxidoreductase [Deltaproteobacteria bacterium]|jgi:2,4-dienoyl-CoA reductase-like NADH-dependent reductase (Old Yellow Enzyme family)/thioredoxin reductase|nr:FAD-dependent oxidoreductase [Deltaproteobacteria bacterium]MBT4643614.1 FAD-dependent oxidoreductase [Deltaproteobacteria bacterium]MBT7711157.1 FAD-dependent oxidoreductase [Deltaproteobacteria bacterium]